MWVTEEVSLIEFYRSGLSLAREAGYDAVLCFIAREADAPGAYDDLIRAWQSIDDLTGPKILFLFAGASVRGRHESENIYRQSSERLLFSPHVLMLHSKGLHSERMNRLPAPRHSAMWHYDLQQLRDNTEGKHPLTRRNRYKDERIFARYHPLRPRREDITASQTSQIRQLRDFLSLREQDVPCLHFTFLDGSAPMHHKVTQQMNIYETLKAIVGAIESEDMINTKAEISEIRRKQAALRQEKQQLERKSTSPEQLFRIVMSLLEGAIPLGTEQQGEIQELIIALQSHAKQPSERSRRVAFDRYKSTRALLSGRSDWSIIRSGVQRLIDIASSSNPIDISPSSEVNTKSLEDQKKAALARIAEEYNELDVQKREQERKLESIVAPSGIRARMSRAVSTNTKAFLQSFVVVAARQELEAVRSYLDSEGARRETYPLSENWSAERVSVDQGMPIEFVLMLAPGQGLEDMADMLSFIQSEAKPKTVILVGMMAGIPRKSRLLDVQAPRNIINGTRLGTRSGRVVPELQGRDVDPILHNRLQSLDRSRRKIADIPLVTHKHTVCVTAKLNDLTPELAQAALASDPENAIGIEMEGSALTAKQATQRRKDEATGYLMIKGVADYAGVAPTPEEVATLRPVLEPFEGENTDVLLADPDPTTNKRLKSVLQKIATIRAMRVALALLAEGVQLS